VLSLVHHHDAALVPLVGHVFRTLKDRFFIEETVDVIGNVTGSRSKTCDRYAGRCLSCCCSSHLISPLPVASCHLLFASISTHHGAVVHRSRLPASRAVAVVVAIIEGPPADTEALNLALLSKLAATPSKDGKFDHKPINFAAVAAVGKADGADGAAGEDTDGSTTSGPTAMVEDANRNDGATKVCLLATCYSFRYGCWYTL